MDQSMPSEHAGPVTATFGDIVAIALFAAAIGGFVTPTGIFAVVAISEPSDFSKSPMWIVMLLSYGAIGSFISIFTAAPVGIVVGCAIWRMLGTTMLNAAISGVLAAVALASLVVPTNGLSLIECLFVGLFMLLGAASAISGYYIVLLRPSRGYRD